MSSIQSFITDPVYSDGDLTWRNILAKDQFIDTIEGIRTLHDIPVQCALKHPERRCVGRRRLLNTEVQQKTVDGVERDWTYFELSGYEWLTYREFAELFESFAASLKHFGFAPKDRFVIFEDTCLEWNVAAQGAFQEGGVVVTMYSNMGRDAIQYAMKEGSAKGMLMNARNINMIRDMDEGVESLKMIICVGEVEQESKTAFKEKGIKLFDYEEFIAIGSEMKRKELNDEADEEPKDEVDETNEASTEEKEHVGGKGTTLGAESAETEDVGKANSQPSDRSPSSDDIALIMYTSGTTGNPKGVVLRHRNVIAAMAATLQILEKDVKIDRENDRYLSFLPLAHILSFVVHYCAFYLGIPVGYGGIKTLMDQSLIRCQSDLKELRPTIFVGVPTIFERIKIGIERKLRQMSWIKRKLFEWSLYMKKQLKWTTCLGVDSLVFRKIQSELGGQVRFIISGGAALSPEIMEFTRYCLSCIIIQGYGLTETCGPSSVQRYDDISTSSVGIPIPCVEMKLVDVHEKGYSIHDVPHPRGEIWIRGTNVAEQYYLNEEETRTSFIDGWFKTGDIGELRSDGTLAIVDRIKNLVKPLHGEYIALEHLETVYKSNEWVSQILVYVDSYHNDCIALIVPVKDLVESKASQLRIEGTYEDLCKNRKIRDLAVKSLMDSGKRNGFSSIEFIRNVCLLTEEWTVENDLLTPGQKVKRNKVVEMHQDEIEQMYEEIKERRKH